MIRANRQMQNLPDVATAERAVPWSCGFPGCSVSGTAASEREAAQARADHMATCTKAPS